MASSFSSQCNYGPEKAPLFAAVFQYNIGNHPLLRYSFPVVPLAHSLYLGGLFIWCIILYQHPFYPHCFDNRRNSEYSIFMGFILRELRLLPKALLSIRTMLIDMMVAESRQTLQDINMASGISNGAMVILSLIFPPSLSI